MTTIFDTSSYDYDTVRGQIAEEQGVDVDELEVSDQDIWGYAEVLQQDDYDLNIEADLIPFFNGRTVLFTGTVGRWDGRFTGGKVGTFRRLLSDALKDCEHITIVDRRGHLHVHGDHHDGSNEFEVLVLTEAGERAWADWCDGARFGKLSEQGMHARLMASRRFSRLPHFAKTVWGCRETA